MPEVAAPNDTSAHSNEGAPRLSMDRYQRHWEGLGSHDPYWAVLSDPAKKGGGWDKAEFFELGRREIGEVVSRLARLGVATGQGVALDFGCGVGRLSRALSEHFERVIGVDISESMLGEARAQHRDFPNIEFVHNAAPGLAPIPSGSIDLVYSNIVLQHMPASLQLKFIGEFGRVLRSGGVAVFQTPARYDLTRLRGWVHFVGGNHLMNLVRRATHGGHGVVELHPLAREAVLAALGKSGMAVLEVERFDSTGPGFVSFRYFARKR